MTYKTTIKSSLKSILFLCGYLITAQSSFEISSPEMQGVSSEKLELLNETMHSFVDNNDISAIQTAILKNGKLIHFDSYGNSDISEKNTLKNDDIFRIASMTKPIISVGLMMLHEEGKFELDDPVYKYIPEFKNVGILDKFFTKDSTFTTKPTKKKITIRNLLTHTSGLGYGFIDGNPEIKATYVKEKNKFMPEGVLGFSDSDVTIEETIKRKFRIYLLRSTSQQDDKQ